MHTHHFKRELGSQSFVISVKKRLLFGQWLMISDADCFLSKRVHNNILPEVLTDLF